MSSDDKYLCCNNFYKEVSKVGFYDCCAYPKLVVYRWDYNDCVEKCSNFTNDKRCCALTCCLKSLNIIGKKENLGEIYEAGLKYSFQLSVCEMFHK
jgi:hypothetical protein